MTTPQQHASPAPADTSYPAPDDRAPYDRAPDVARPDVARPDDAPPDDALGAAGRALAAVENLPLERHPEAFAHFDELLRAALEAPPHVGSG
jgi:hypothetical protein